MFNTGGRRGKRTETVTWEHLKTPTPSPIVILQVSSFDAEVSF